MVNRSFESLKLVIIIENHHQKAIVSSAVRPKLDFPRQLLLTILPNALMSTSYSETIDINLFNSQLIILRRVVENVGHHWLRSRAESFHKKREQRGPQSGRCVARVTTQERRQMCTHGNQPDGYEGAPRSYNFPHQELICQFTLALHTLHEPFLADLINQSAQRVEVKPPIGNDLLAVADHCIYDEQKKLT